MTLEAAEARPLLSGMDALASALRDQGDTRLGNASAFAGCLMPLLQALGWRGSARDVADALPHFASNLDMVEFRNVLVTLGYESQARRTSLRLVDPRLMPCLFVPDDGGARVLLAREDDRVEYVDGDTVQTRIGTVDGRRGTAIFFTEADPAERAAAQAGGRQNWFSFVIRRFRPVIARLLVVSLFLNLLALLVPLFIMVTYDRVIGARAQDTLIYLAIGIGIAFAADVVLRVIRSKVMGWVAGRLDYVFGTESFRQVLGLPPGLTERATVGAQVARLKEFESLREFFTGPLANVVFELPFLIIFILVIWAIAGPVAFVPVVMIAAFCVFGAVFAPMLRDAVEKASKARAERQSFLVESLANLRAVKAGAADQIWRDRYRSLLSGSVMASYKTGRRMVVLQTISHSIMMVAGIAVLGLGTLRVLEGQMTVGALVATMALVWRVLAPLQAGFLAFSRLEQVRHGIRQLNALMQLPPERRHVKSSVLSRDVRGQISFSRVSFRYSQDTDPALLGVSFNVQAGEMVAVIGNNGSGKSSLLKLIAGLYQPQAGRLAIDGLDLRQIDPVALRRSVAYVPQHPHLFHGSISQNLRLADPTATDDQLARAAAEAGVLDRILRLPKGFETRLGDNSSVHLPYGFAQRLVMARALIRDASILLMDEPARSLDDSGDLALIQLLKRLKRRTTIVMVSHRPSHIRLADRVIVMDQGTVRYIGAPADALHAMQSLAA